MGKFAIAFAGKDMDIEGDKIAVGKLSIGEFTETFHASISYWDREKYVKQWRKGLERLLEGKNKSALITTMYNPKYANFIVWWLLYRLNDEIRVQNHVLIMKFLKKNFDEQNMYDFIPHREIKTDEGERISEWVLKLSDIKTFLTKR